MANGVVRPTHYSVRAVRRIVSRANRVADDARDTVLRVRRAVQQTDEMVYLVRKVENFADDIEN